MSKAEAIEFEREVYNEHGQVAIPKPIRQYLGITEDDTVTFSVENGEIKLYKS